MFEMLSNCAGDGEEGGWDLQEGSQVRLNMDLQDPKESLHE